MTTSEVINLIRGLLQDGLRGDGRKAYEYGTDNKFTLPEPFVSSATINVYQNGNLLSTDDWSYNSSTNQVTISFVSSGWVLTSGDIILITFSYYGKYSDAELLQYLESGLIYFTQYRYKKSFILDSDDNIVAINGVNPTTQEFQMIAMISALSIDPDNVTIRTKEFTINGTEEKSKSELIGEAFAVFQKFVGSITFEIYGTTTI